MRQTSQKMSKKSRKRLKKRKIIARILWFLQLITTILFSYEAYASQMVPSNYLVGIIAVFIVALIFTGIFMFLFTRKKPYFIGALMAVLMAILCGAGFYYMHGAVSTLKNISGANIQVAGYGVYVDTDDEAETIEDAASYTYGIVAVQDRDNTNQVIEQINTELGGDITVKTYEDMYAVTDAVLSQEIDAMIINGAYIAILEDEEQYADLQNQIKVIANYTVESSTENTSVDEADGIFAVYISGIDVAGDISTTSRSDVNIIAVVNRNTHQILLVSTPRDYYVPTSVSNGQNDKLTHAGLYGIECSMQTLGMLYDIDVQYYFRVNFTGFENIIDAVGGIDVYSEKSFTSWSKKLYFQAGMNHLNGEYALEFARERHAFASGDNQRGANQMKVIEAVINACTSPAILNDYASLLSSLNDSFETSVPYSMISDIVQEQLSSGGSWDIQKISATGEGTKATTYSAPSQYAYVMLPDEEVVTKITEYINRIEDNELIDIEADEAAANGESTSAE